ncbi:MAG: hypothetical protein ACXV76_11910, partial [Halobacteriota archaeon]
MSKMTEIKEMWLNGSASGKKWLDSLGSNETKKIFTNFFKIYCEAVGKTPEQLLTLKITGLRNTGNKREFQAEDLLEGYLRKTTLKPSG